MVTRHFLLFVVIFYLVFAFVKAREGDLCIINGVQGICRLKNNCPNVAANKRENSQLCGDSGDIICCNMLVEGLTTARTKRASETSTVYTPKEYMYEDREGKMGKDVCEPIAEKLTSKPTGQKSWDKCLEYQEYVYPCEKSAALGGTPDRVVRCHHNADELIIGGTEAKELEFPHMVLLGYKDHEGHIEWQCGGSLVSEKFILTAGHCISDLRQINVSHALIGVLKRSQESPKNIYEIKRIIKHDEYQSPIKYNDIALLELKNEVKLSHRIVPACLHTGDTADSKKVLASGWGSTAVSRQVNSDVLQKVVLTEFDNEDCSKVYGSTRHMKMGYQSTSQMCYGDKAKSQDACRGDSGGPIQVKSKRMSCMYVIVGVTSFGEECGKIGLPGVYTRVSHYLPWIESIVWP